MKGRKLEFRQKSNGQRIDHYDEASNIEYKNAGSGLTAGNVQEAITELASRPAGQGNVITGETYVKLEDCPGFDESFVAPLPEYYDPREHIEILDRIYGVFPSDTDFEDENESMVWETVPNGWDGSTVSWNESNPRNWYFDKYRGRDGATNNSKPHVTDQYYDCIRSGQESDWFASYDEANSEAISRGGNNIVFYSERVWNMPNKRFTRYSNPLPVEGSNLTDDDLHESTTDRLHAYQETFLTNNAELLERGRATTAFIQSVLNSISPNTILLFPANKTLVLNFNPRIRQYGRYSNPGYDYYDENYRYKIAANSFYFYCLFVRHRVNIDLNNSTLRIVPTWTLAYRLITVQDENLLEPDITFPYADVPCGGEIYNGEIMGDRPNHLYLPIQAAMETSTMNYGYFHEGCGGVSVKSTVCIRNLKIHDFPGDGVGFSSPYKGISAHIVCNTRGRLDEANTSDVTATVPNEVIINDQGEPTGYWYSTKLTISVYHSDPNYSVIMRPIYQTNSLNKDYSSNVELAPYFVDEEFWVSYYNDAGNFISYETLAFGDALNIPSDATYFRFFIHIDPTIEPYGSNGNNPPKIDLLAVEVNWKERPHIEACEIYNCGRNGITPTAMRNGVIKNCNIYSDSRNSQASLDIEGVTYIDTNVTVEDAWLHGKKANITCPTGDHLHIINCKVGSLYCANPFLRLEDSTINVVDVHTKFFNNIVHPRRLLDNCRINKKLSISYGLVKNCRIKGIIDLSESYSAESAYPTIYENSVFRVDKLAPGIYKNCTIRVDDLLSSNKQYMGFDTYYYKSPYTIESNRYVFENCTIMADSLHGIPHSKTENGVPVCPLLNFKNCNITLHQGYTNGLFEDSGCHFLQCYIESFIGNTVSIVGRNGKSGIKFIPYGNCVIKGNNFKAAQPESEEITSDNPEVTNFTCLLLKFHKTTVTKAYIVRVEDNTFEYIANASDPSDSSTYSNTGIKVQQTSNTYKPDTNVTVSIKNNVFYKVGTGPLITPYTAGSMSAVGCSFTVDADNNMAVNGGTLNVQNNG